MYGCIALRCPSHRQAQAASRRVAADPVRQLLSLRAVAVVWADRRGRRSVEQSTRRMRPPGHDWSWWLMLSAAVWCGGMMSASTPARSAGPAGWTERVDEATTAEVARRLGLGEAAVVLALDQPTPLLAVEALLGHVSGLVWTSLPARDAELITAVLRTSPSV